VGGESHPGFVRIQIDQKLPVNLALAPGTTAE